MDPQMFKCWLLKYQMWLKRTNWTERGGFAKGCRMSRLILCPKRSSVKLAMANICQLWKRAVDVIKKKNKTISSTLPSTHLSLIDANIRSKLFHYLYVRGTAIQVRSEDLWHTIEGIALTAFHKLFCTSSFTAGLVLFILTSVYLWRCPDHVVIKVSFQLYHLLQQTLVLGPASDVELFRRILVEVEQERRFTESEVTRFAIWVAAYRVSGPAGEEVGFELFESDRVHTDIRFRFPWVVVKCLPWALVEKRIWKAYIINDVKSIIKKW